MAELHKKFEESTSSNGIEFHHFAHFWFSKTILEKWKHNFALYDVDNSGSLEKEELESFLAILGQHGEREKEIREKLEEFDTDGKEGISFEEFKNFVESDIKDKLDPIMERVIKKATKDILKRDF
ncbi:uncharacterized protein LOC141909808 isoform X2 [Tubulanus polymorphus]|uniref:uncharacterized protein LOC141909808 isoform X2 n=1 Tax=Tubulanus polymorphus TaxID=672921 RepID=UPI003DA6006E